MSLKTSWLYLCPTRPPGCFVRTGGNRRRAWWGQTEVFIEHCSKTGKGNRGAQTRRHRNSDWVEGWAWSPGKALCSAARRSWSLGSKNRKQGCSSYCPGTQRRHDVSSLDQPIEQQEQTLMISKSVKKNESTHLTGLLKLAVSLLTFKCIFLIGVNMIRKYAFKQKPISNETLWQRQYITFFV